MQMTDVVNRRHMRHAHMVNIEKKIMLEGMRADFQKVDELSIRVMEIVSKAHSYSRQDRRRHRHHSRAEPRLQMDQDQRHHLHRTSGVICRAARSSPLRCEVNGTFVIDGVVGDYLCAKYGDLRDEPLTIASEGQPTHGSALQQRELEDEFWQYTHTDENSDRVGEFAIGTNIGLQGVIGNILQDEKIAGHPYGFRQSLRRSYRRRVDFFHAHRRSGHASSTSGPTAARSCSRATS